MKHIIVVGDMKAGEKEGLLITHALGSCLGLIAYDPQEKIGGLLHAMLPLSKINRDKAQANPCMFVDTGVPTLFKTFNFPTSKFPSTCECNTNDLGS